MSFLNRKLRANGLEFNLREIGVKEPTLEASGELAAAITTAITKMR